MNLAPVRHDRLTTLIRWAIYTAVMVVPLTVVPPAKDPFRIPKELEFRALAIVLIGAAVAGAWNQVVIRRIRPELTIAGAAVAWSAVATLFSANRELSVLSLATIVLSAAIFTVAVAFAHEWSAAAVRISFVPALINAGIMITQALSLWTPFTDGTSKVETALLGNRNDAGCYLLAPTIAAFVMTGITTGRRRMLYGLVAAALFVGLLATQTVSAIVAFFAALVGFAVIAKWRSLKPIVVGVALAATIAVLALLSRSAGDIRLVVVPLKGKVEALAHGDLSLLTSHRVEPFLAAWQMFRGSPITGVGPGVFKFEYFSHALNVEQAYAPLLSPYGERVNYSEVHNDHMQVLAETGIVGFVILLIFGAYIASRSLRAHTSEDANADERAVISRHLALPLVIGFAVLAVGQFPLQLAAPRLTFLFWAALCCGWSRL